MIRKPGSPSSRSNPTSSIGRSRQRRSSPRLPGPTVSRRRRSASTATPSTRSVPGEAPGRCAGHRSPRLLPAVLNDRDRTRRGEDVAHCCRRRPGPGSSRRTASLVAHVARPGGGSCRVRSGGHRGARCSDGSLRRAATDRGSVGDRASLRQRHLQRHAWRRLSGRPGRRVEDFSAFLSTRNRAVADRHQVRLREMPELVDCAELLEAAEAADDAQLMRLTLEYLPLTFSRRHGDPSRPWNTFSIRVRDDDGDAGHPLRGQLARHLPELGSAVSELPAVPAGRRLGVRQRLDRRMDSIPIGSPGTASTGRCRIPDDPWSHIGYWGDHQIVYLRRLLEATRRFLPGALEATARRGDGSPTPTFPIASFPTRRCCATRRRRSLRRSRRDADRSAGRRGRAPTASCCGVATVRSTS